MPMSKSRYSIDYEKLRQYSSWVEFLFGVSWWMLDKICFILYSKDVGHDL